MKNFIIICSLFTLNACGTMGIGTNHHVNIQNDSDHVVTATGSHGSIKIQPNSSQTIHGSKPIQLTSKGCPEQTIDTQSNVAALALDLIPGMFIFWLPFFIDAVSGGASNLPENYNYVC